jgi:predicted AlkP superfamily pyrophosphatase or phosphodiesterase
MKKQLLLLTAAFGLIGSVSAQNRKVLFIGIDGVRYDALQQANTPIMDSLMNAGLYTYDSWHLGITVSGPSWSTMLCGVWESKHGVTNNSYTNANYNSYPYIGTRAKEVDPTLKCVQIITWNPMDDASNGTGGYVFNSGWDYSIDAGNHSQGLITAAAQVQLQDPDLDYLFIHYDECDATGHSSGFSTGNTAYINAIQGVDAEIGQVMNYLRARPNYANEDWLVMCTTDHGGIGLGHGGNTNTERHIWWWASGPSVPHMQITSADPGSYQLGNLNQTAVDNCPVLADIAVTALHHLIYADGDPTVTHPEWDLDGKSWLSMSTYVEELNGQDFKFEIYPNPSEGKFTAVFDRQGEEARYEITDLSGKVIDANTISGNFGESRVQFDITNYESGMYMLRIVDGERVSTRRIIRK